MAMTESDYDEFDPLALGAAFAMRQAGFSDEEIETALGHLPDMTVSTADLDAYEAWLDGQVTVAGA